MPRHDDITAGDRQRPPPSFALSVSSLVFGGKFEFDEISNIVIVIESVSERNLTVTIDGTCFIYIEDS